MRRPNITRITVEPQDWLQLETPMLAVSLFAEDGVDESLAPLDEALGGALRRRKESGEITGKAKSITVLHTPALTGNGSPSAWVLVVVLTVWACPPRSAMSMTGGRRNRFRTTTDSIEAQSRNTLSGARMSASASYCWRSLRSIARPGLP